MHFMLRMLTPHICSQISALASSELYHIPQLYLKNLQNVSIHTANSVHCLNTKSLNWQHSEKVRSVKSMFDCLPVVERQGPQEL